MNKRGEMGWVGWGPTSRRFQGTPHCIASNYASDKCQIIRVKMKGGKQFQTLRLFRFSFQLFQTICIIYNRSVWMCECHNRGDVRHCYIMSKVSFVSGWLTLPGKPSISRSANANTLRGEVQLNYMNISIDQQLIAKRERKRNLNRLNIWFRRFFQVLLRISKT